jgi:hypothetical protein
MAVFWDAVQCSLVKTDASEKLAACIIVIITLLGHYLPKYAVQHPRSKPSSYSM